MALNIHVGTAGAHGVEPTPPSSAAVTSLDDAIYHTVHGGPGGVHALAARMGMSVNTLTHKVNPNTDSHFLRPQELMAVQALTGDPRVLHAMAAALGYTCQRAAPDQAGGNSVEAFMRLQCAQADFARAVADPLARMESDASAWPNRHELRRAQAMAAELHAAVDHMVATLHAHRRPEPEVC